jgi:hypothetical protein
MPLLASRISADTVAKFERAARRRYTEAARLVHAEPLGAIYLFGYTIEIRLKAAYYRLSGLAPNSDINPYRKAAERQIRQLRKLPAYAAVGHDLYGWALLVEDTRANTPWHGAAATSPCREPESSRQERRTLLDGSASLSRQ